MKSIFPILAVLILFPATANAQVEDTHNIANFSGNDLLAHCPAHSYEKSASADEVLQKLACVMYIGGFAHGFQIAERALDQDSPDFSSERTMGQLYDIVRKYVEDHPASREQSIQVLMIAALLDSSKNQGTPSSKSSKF